MKYVVYRYFKTPAKDGKRNLNRIPLVVGGKTAEKGKMTTEYNIYKVKIDKRYRKGYRPKTFKYIDTASDYTTARKKAETHKENGYAVGIETITRY